MGKKVIIDADECIGCESCVELCSEVFAFNEAEEIAEVILPEGGPEDCIEEAIESCPVESIAWEEASQPAFSFFCIVTRHSQKKRGKRIRYQSIQ